MYSFAVPIQDISSSIVTLIQDSRLQQQIHFTVANSWSIGMYMLGCICYRI